ncbi:hypothetical protein Nepgr_008974 [Nepenthes gracilis]|uniref:Phytocyanin domain-containing protein n=1 Tax=Nepenthes gracilis TaxID=150966 RepID=A0AAD3SAL0_NEPGR|nr:hypothetical protein Nepgr_008974 [Nepenthes gracilis]
MVSLTVVMAVAVVVATVGTVEVVGGRKPELHRVGGGKQTWKLDVNYTDWASRERFYVGDWLCPKTFNVLEVNKTGYDKCIETTFITNITRGGRDVFNLTEAKPYYFISGRGFCVRGVKLAVNVEEYTPRPPASRINSNLHSHASRMFPSLTPLIGEQLDRGEESLGG